MPQKTTNKSLTALWPWQATAPRSSTNILQALASENKHFADLLKFTPRRGSQPSRSRPHHRPLAATRSNRLAHPQSPPPLNQHHRLSRPQTRESPAWPQTTTVSKSRAALFHRQQSTLLCLSPLARRLNRPNAATSAAGKTAHASQRLSRKPNPTQFSKSLALPTATPLNLLATAQPATFTTPKAFVLATSASSFRLLCASSSAPAQRLRQRHGVFSQKHCWRRYSAFKPPTLPHGEAVSAERTVGRSPTPRSHGQKAAPPPKIRANPPQPGHRNARPAARRAGWGNERPAFALLPV